MPETNRSAMRYRVLRYTPNLIRDEWVNIGVLLEDAAKQRARARLIDETSEFARVRRLHPNADEALLRGLPGLFEVQPAAAGASAAWIEKVEQTLSTTLQFGPPEGVFAEDFDAELDRLYHDKVAPPARQGRAAAMVENTRAWIRTRLNDVFRRHRILAKMEKNVKVEQFTQAGDPMRIDYAYRHNGTRGYLHALSLGRDPAQAKVLAYTAGRVRAQQSNAEFTAITEVAPQRENQRHQFIVRLFDEQKITIVPLPQVEMFAERLRPRLQG
ncbi:MAG TPA: DUF3037 domain-containing protein [Candidatus Acidoferrales bacterium]|nr:DUF3037 domain-containing protein [Candidatus Acidoferrales bacterium]